MSKPNGGPAFPQMINNGGQQLQYTGLTMRDYIAVRVLQGLCANDRWNATSQPENVARSAYEIADAMLAERAKP